jgi:RNA polymerase sporulation-specific sigma factor
MSEGTVPLILRAQAGDGAAAEQLIAENSGLIWSIARRFFGRGVERDDLYQLGCVGFLKAVNGFDAAYGTQFSTYAVPKIAGEIRRFLRDDGAVKVSRSVKERALRIRLARGALEQSLGREPTLSELAAQTGLSPEDIATAETATGPAESLQQESGEENFTLEHVLCDASAEERMLERFALSEAIARLAARERMVVSLRYFHGLTQQKCAGILGISQVQVSRLERRALDALRELLKTAEA